MGWILEQFIFCFSFSELSEMALASGKAKPLKKELICKETQKSLPKSVKRQSKQNSYLDDSTTEVSPRKKLKSSTSDTTVMCGMENELSIDGCLDHLKRIEPPSSDSLDMTDSVPSISSLTKGTKPIQALLAKNIGNKVTLTSQVPPTAIRSISASEKRILSPVSYSPVKAVLPCQTGSKSPLQVLYKIPGGHCLPIDLQNNSVKIQVQPVVDCKTGEKNTGEKIMQQVLIFPKNFLIPHRESKSVTQDCQSRQQKTPELHSLSPPQPVSVSTTALPTSSTTLLSSTNFKNSTTCLPQGANVANRLLTSPSITLTGNVLASVVNMNQKEATKTQAVVPAASFPVASSTVSSAAQSLTATLPQSVSVCSSTSSPGLASPQKSSDIGEAKQELKTVCIRDSQSILVRTRGGNTGIVKVQTNSDQISPSNLSPSSVFTYAPQLQAFFVPNSKQLATSTFSAVTTTASTFSKLVQPTSTTSASVSTVPSAVNHLVGKNMTLVFGQPHNSGSVGLGMQKAVPVSSPTFLSPMSSSNIVGSTSSNSSGKVISPGNIGQSSPSITQTPFINQQLVDVNSTKVPVKPPESPSTTSGNMASANQIQKLTLVTNPPLLPACGAAGINLMPAPTSTGISAQNLMFINTPPANIRTSTSLSPESFKQSFPPSMGKTYIKSTEHPQLVLIPSTVGTSVKVNTSPTVSQIKDVKIGLNIGQAIINSTGNAQSVPSINIMQPAFPKDAEEKNSQSVILPLSTYSGLVPACSSMVSQSLTSVSESLSIATRTANMSAVAANTCLDPTSVVFNGNASGTQPANLSGGTDTSTKAPPVLTTRLRTSSVGNSVAISTVKTGHLSSSVLISTTQPTLSHQTLSPTFQLPAALPGPVNDAPKMIKTVPQLPVAAQSMPFSTAQQSTLIQFQSPGISGAVPTHGSAQKPQTVLPPNAPNAGKAISFSNFVSLPPNFGQPAPAANSALGASTTAGPASSSLASHAGGQLNDSCIQQKIIINTCSPLAPGTQIMISGTRFIVPPQGLGAGSHVLLISTNPKLGPLLTVTHGNGLQGAPSASPTPQKPILMSNSTLSSLPLKQPLKSSTKIVNSLGTANTLPIMHATSQIVESATKPCAPTSATALSNSSVKQSPSTTLAKTSLGLTTQADNSQLQGSTSVLRLDTSIKKLMVSPEGAILNTINTPPSNTSSLPPSFSPDIVSTTRNPALVFPNFLKSSIGIPDTAAS